MRFMTNYNWEIEFIPENPKVAQVENLEFVGTRGEVELFAAANHPDYNCQQVVFHRSGEAHQAEQKHATVVRDGFTVPLIGIPPEAVLQACDCCGEETPLSQTVFTGSQTLCPKCNKP